ncbi:MAG: hypothetical protein ACI9CP_000964 [Cryomorphaceae bacterium]|jgi:hypothetical protein
MKLLRVRRKTKTEKGYNSSMGLLTTRVSSIKKYLMGIPIQTLQKSRETYSGEIKNSSDCILFI